MSRLFLVSVYHSGLLFPLPQYNTLLGILPPLLQPFLRLSAPCLKH